jgi:hypothetical protein
MAEDTEKERRGFQLQMCEVSILFSSLRNMVSINCLRNRKHEWTFGRTRNIVGTQV